MKKSIYSKEYDAVRLWLKGAREEQGLTMRDLAAKMSVPHSFIGKVEQGERRLDVVEYVKYCESLEISPEEGILLIKK